MCRSLPISTYSMVPHKHGILKVGYNRSMWNRSGPAVDYDNQVFESARSNGVLWDFGTDLAKLLACLLHLHQRLLEYRICICCNVFGLKNCVTISTNSLLLNMVNVHLYYAFLLVTEFYNNLVFTALLLLSL